MNKQFAEPLQAGLYSDNTEYRPFEATNGQRDTAIAETGCFETMAGIPRQVYQLHQPKVLPQRKVYLRKLGWRILPIVSNGEQNLRHR